MILVEFAIDWAEEEVTPHYSESDMLISWHIFPSKKQDSYLGRWDEEAQIRMMRRADSWLVFQTRAADNGSVSLLNDKPACSAPKSLSCESQMNGSQWMLRGVTMGELVTVCIPILKSSSNHATAKVKPSYDPASPILAELWWACDTAWIVGFCKRTFSSILFTMFPQELFQLQCAIRNRHHMVFAFSPNPQNRGNSLNSAQHSLTCCPPVAPDTWQGYNLCSWGSIQCSLPYF